MPSSWTKTIWHRFVTLTIKVRLTEPVLFSCFSSHWRNKFQHSFKLKIAQSNLEISHPHQGGQIPIPILLSEMPAITKYNVQFNRTSSILYLAATYLYELFFWPNYNTSVQWRQLWLRSLSTRLLASGTRENVKEFQKWNVKDSLSILSNRSVCWAASSSSIGAAKYLNMAIIIYLSNMR